VAQLDIGRTAFIGFDLIRRNPLAPAVWGIVQTVLLVGPLLLVLPVLADFMTMAFDAGRAGHQPQMADIVAIQSRMAIISPLSWIAELLARGLVIGAVFRAVLSPADGKWFFMRIGMAELMLVCVSLVFSILLAIGMMVGAIVVAIVALIAGFASQTVGVLVAVVGVLALVGVMLWVGVRFALGFAMSFDRKGFLLFESWPLTKGHGGGLLAVAVLNLVVVGLIQALVFGAVFGVAVFAIIGAGGIDASAWSDPEAYFTPARIAALVPPLIPWAVGLGLIGAVLSGYFIALFMAPWAEAYRVLQPSDGEIGVGGLPA
jgi:hypothetical protein